MTDNEERDAAAKAFDRLIRSRLVFPQLLIVAVIAMCAGATIARGNSPWWPIIAVIFAIDAAFGYAVAELHRLRAEYWRDERGLS